MSIDSEREPLLGEDRMVTKANNYSKFDDEDDENPKSRCDCAWSLLGWIGWLFRTIFVTPTSWIKRKSQTWFEMHVFYGELPPEAVDPQYGTKVKRLKNLRNTCFFNSMNQSLNQTVALRRVLREPQNHHYVLTIPDEEDMDMTVSSKFIKLTLQLCNFYHEIDTTDLQVVVPRGVLRELSKRNPRFGRGTEEDSHEALRCILDGLKMEEIDKIKARVYKKYGVTEDSESHKKLDPEDRRLLKMYLRMANKQSVPIETVFGGKQISTTICRECLTPLQNEEPIFDISLPLPAPKEVGASINQHPQKKDQDKEPDQSSITEISSNLDDNKPTSMTETSLNNTSSPTTDGEVAMLVDISEPAMTDQDDSATAKESGSSVATTVDITNTDNSITTKEDQDDSTTAKDDQGDSAKDDQDDSATAKDDQDDVHTTKVEDQAGDHTTNTDQDDSGTTQGNKDGGHTAKTDQDDSATAKESESSVATTVGITNTDNSITTKEDQDDSTTAKDDQCDSAKDDQDDSATAKDDQDDVHTTKVEDQAGDYTTNTDQDDVNATMVDQDDLSIAKDDQDDTTTKDDQDVVATTKDDQGDVKDDQDDTTKDDQDVVATTKDDHGDSVTTKDDVVTTKDDQNDSVPGKNDIVGEDTSNVGLDSANVSDKKSVELNDTEISSSGKSPSSTEYDQDITLSKTRLNEYVKSKGLHYQVPYEVAKCPTGIEKALQDYTALDVLDKDNKFICQNCTLKRAKPDGDPDDVALCLVSKQIAIHQLPQVLILHVKRFTIEFDGVFKDTQHISFPFKLNMAPYCTRKCMEGMADDNNEIWYGLYAVVVHDGDTLEHGHYFAYVRRRPERKPSEILPTANWKYDQSAADDGPWLYASDVTIRVPEQPRDEVKKQEAYMLFYELLPKVEM